MDLDKEQRMLELHRPELSVLEEVLNILSQEPVIPE